MKLSFLAVLYVRGSAAIFSQQIEAGFLRK